MGNIQFDFNQKRAVVTGGASGIGRCITEKFLQANAQVSVWDYSEAALSEVEAIANRATDASSSSIPVSNASSLPIADALAASI